VSDILDSNLKAMFDVERIEQVPEEVRRRCERVEKRIRRVKPYGDLASTQALAVICEQYSRERMAKNETRDG